MAMLSLWPMGVWAVQQGVQQGPRCGESLRRTRQQTSGNKHWQRCPVWYFITGGATPAILMA